MTKEEILKLHVSRYYQHKGKILSDDDILPLSRVRSLMDEYAKQEAIEFKKWCYINENLLKDNTSEQLYSLWEQTKLKK